MSTHGRACSLSTGYIQANPRHLISLRYFCGFVVLSNYTVFLIVCLLEGLSKIRQTWMCRRRKLILRYKNPRSSPTVRFHYSLLRFSKSLKTNVTNSLVLAVALLLFSSNTNIDNFYLYGSWYVWSTVKLLKPIHLVFYNSRVKYYPFYRWRKTGLSNLPKVTLI